MFIYELASILACSILECSDLFFMLSRIVFVVELNLKSIIKEFEISSSCNHIEITHSSSRLEQRMICKTICIEHQYMNVELN